MYIVRLLSFHTGAIFSYFATIIPVNHNWCRARSRYNAQGIRQIINDLFFTNARSCVWIQACNDLNVKSDVDGGWVLDIHDYNSSENIVLGSKLQMNLCILTISTDIKHIRWCINKSSRLNVLEHKFNNNA